MLPAASVQTQLNYFLQVGSNKGDTISFNLVNLQFSVAAKAAGIAEDKFGAQAGATAFVKGDSIQVNFSTAGTAADIIGYMDQMIAYVDMVSVLI